MCPSCLCTVTLHNVPHEDILYGIHFILRMVTFIYFPIGYGVFDYLEPLEERLCRPREEGKKFHYHYALYKTLRKN